MSQTVSQDTRNIPLSPKAKELLENVFLPRYQALLEQARTVPLSILVWGPGASGGDLYQKGLQIGGALQQRGHAALFSEEVSDISADDTQVLSEKGKEFLQAQAADFIVVLMASYGSVAEVYHVAEFGYSGPVNRSIMEIGVVRGQRNQAFAS